MKYSHYKPTGLYYELKTNTQTKWDKTEEQKPTHILTTTVVV